MIERTNLSVYPFKFGRLAAVANRSTLADAGLRPIADARATLLLMCGRTALTATSDELRKALGLDDVADLEPHYNVPPSRPVAAVRTPGKLELLRWGLVPFWATDAKIGRKLALARVEGVASTPAFRDAIRHRRCLVIVSGFFEWRRAGTGVSAPFFIRRPNGKPLALAGVWDRWVSKDGEVVESCAILTQPARAPVDAIHDRMPLVLEQEHWSPWLDRKTTDVGAMLDPRAPDLVTFAVTSYVNDPRHDDPAVLRPTDRPAQGVLFED